MNVFYSLFVTYRLYALYVIYIIHKYIINKCKRKKREKKKEREGGRRKTHARFSIAHHNSKLIEYMYVSAANQHV